MPRLTFLPADYFRPRRLARGGRRAAVGAEAAPSVRRPPRRRLPRERTPVDYPPTHEATFFEQLRPLLNHHGWRWYHTQRSEGSNGGFPDLVAVRSETGEVIYAELKGWEGRIEPPQVDWLDDLTQTGQRCYLWYPWHYDEAWTVLTDRAGGQDVPRWPYGGTA